MIVWFFGRRWVLSADRDVRREARLCYAHFRGAGFGPRETPQVARQLVAQLVLFPYLPAPWQVDATQPPYGRPS